MGPCPLRPLTRCAHRARALLLCCQACVQGGRERIFFFGCTTPHLFSQLLLLFCFFWSEVFALLLIVLRYGAVSRIASPSYPYTLLMLYRYLVSIYHSHISFGGGASSMFWCCACCDYFFLAPCSCCCMGVDAVVSPGGVAWSGFQRGAELRFDRERGKHCCTASGLNTAVL